MSESEFEQSGLAEGIALQARIHAIQVVVTYSLALQLARLGKDRDATAGMLQEVISRSVEMMHLRVPESTQIDLIKDLIKQHACEMVATAAGSASAVPGSRR